MEWLTTLELWQDGSFCVNFKDSTLLFWCSETQGEIELVRQVIDVNEHTRLSNCTLRHKLKYRISDFIHVPHITLGMGKIFSNWYDPKMSAKHEPQPAVEQYYLLLFIIATPGHLYL